MEEIKGDFDIVIVGAGIVGLATGYQLLKQKPELRLGFIEKEREVAQHQTSHNSGVIHSGIYYKPGSLKALNCKRGYELLLAYATEKAIPFELCGKVIVATCEEELPRLKDIYERGRENGLEGIRFLNQAELREKEPNVAGLEAIWVPQTGIIDYEQVAFALKGDLLAMGARFYYNAQLKKVAFQDKSQILHTPEGSFKSRLSITTAGLYSDKVLKKFGVRPRYRIIPFRGEYYELKESAQHLVNNLIYPVPDPAFPFLGVHFTRMIKGGIEAGPNAVFAFRREGYSKWSVKPSELLGSLAWPGFRKVIGKYWKTGMGEIYRSFSKGAFTKALQKLMPGLSEADLKPGGAGVRAQACMKDGTLIDDFLIEEHRGLVHVANAPSPAATSCLAIGETVAQIALKRL